MNKQYLVYCKDNDFVLKAQNIIVPFLLLGCKKCSQSCGIYQSFRHGGCFIRCNQVSGSVTRENKYFY